MYIDSLVRINHYSDMDSLSETMEVTGNLMSVAGHGMEWAQEHQGELAMALNVTGTLMSVAGGVGVPYVGLVGTAVKMGGKLLTPDEEAMDKAENNKNEKNLKAIKENSGANKENLDAIKEILESSFSEMKEKFSDIKTQMESVEKRAVKSFEMLKQIAYMDGIENIAAAYKVFFTKSKQGLSKRIEQFQSHRFELEKQYVQHFNTRKIGQFLNLLKDEGEDGPFCALSMFHHVVTVEAQYLQMMAICHIEEQDMEGLVQRFEDFTSHYRELNNIMANLFMLEEQVDNFTHELFTYKKVTKLAILLSQKKENIEEISGFIPKGLINKPIYFRKNIDDGLLQFHIPLVWIACEAGDEEMLMTLVKLGADINVPAFTDDGLPLSCLWIAAKYGHFSVVTYLLEHGAQVC